MKVLQVAGFRLQVKDIEDSRFSELYSLVI